METAVSAGTVAVKEEAVREAVREAMQVGGVRGAVAKVVEDWEAEREAVKVGAVRGAAVKAQV